MGKCLLFFLKICLSQLKYSKGFQYFSGGKETILLSMKLYRVWLLYHLCSITTAPLSILLQPPCCVSSSSTPPMLLSLNLCACCFLCPACSPPIAIPFSFCLLSGHSSNFTLQWGSVLTIPLKLQLPIPPSWEFLILLRLFCFCSQCLLYYLTHSVLHFYLLLFSDPHPRM